jgi:hypothetical protein
MGTISAVEQVEGVIITVLFVGTVLAWFVRKFHRSRPDLHIGLPLAVAFGIRLLAIAGISATGLQSTLRGGDETTFLDLARVLANSPLGHGFFPHGVYQLQVVLLALQMKLGFIDVGAMRINEVGISLLGVLLMVVAVHDLGSPNAARWAAWFMALEPASIFFDSAIYKDPLMELAGGLIVFGGTWIWRQLDVRGILVCALGGFIGVETRAYAGWFLVAAAVFTLLHAAIRSMNRPMRAMPIIYAIIFAGFLVTPTLLTVTSRKSLQYLQASQNANATGAGEGGTGHAGGSNLALEKVNFSSRGQVLQNLPKRMEELILQPYPWQLSDSSQRFGAIGTLVAYAVLILFIRYAWMSRGSVLSRAGPILYTLFFLLVAYSLAVGNAGTGFRYRTHLVTLGVGAAMVLRAHRVEVPEARRKRIRGRGSRRRRLASTPSPVHDF